MAQRKKNRSHPRQAVVPMECRFLQWRRRLHLHGKFVGCGQRLISWTHRAPVPLSLLRRVEFGSRLFSGVRQLMGHPADDPSTGKNGWLAGVAEEMAIITSGLANKALSTLSVPPNDCRGGFNH